MGFQPGEYLLGKKIDYVFLGLVLTDELRISVPLSL